MTIGKLLAWLIFGEVEHKWQLAISVAFNAIATILIAARGQQPWLALFCAFCAGMGLGRLNYSEKP